MRFLKQPRGYEIEQPLLNKLLFVHVSLEYHSRSIGGDVKSSAYRYYFSSRTRLMLSDKNWRVRIIKKIGS